MLCINIFKLICKVNINYNFKTLTSIIVASFLRSLHFQDQKRVKWCSHQLFPTTEAGNDLCLILMVILLSGINFVKQDLASKLIVGDKSRKRVWNLRLRSLK